MTLFFSTLLFVTVTFYFFIKLIAIARLRRLEVALPSTYEKAAFSSSDDVTAPHLIPLAIDLMRKQRCTPAFGSLSPAERRAALYAFAVETEPRWAVRLLNMSVHGSEKALVRQLRHIKASQPNHPDVHFGAVKAQLQLRTASKT